MMFLLVAVNAKYIHSNPAIYSLAAYAKKIKQDNENRIEIAEYTINQTVASIVADIYRKKPQAVGISCYIWNIEYVYSIISQLGKIMPKIPIWLGGPEVSYDAETVLKEHSELTGIMAGEGEQTFANLLEAYESHKNFADITGIVYRTKDEKNEDIIVNNPKMELTNLSEIPFLYSDLSSFENKIIYYETSRGCPFRCSYCLSSIDRQVRFRDITIVKQELKFFLDNKVKQVKFIDRTFNCNHSHAMEIWQFIKENDNGNTNFHFEIAADILNDEEIKLLNTLRPGAVQMEIGVQSTNEATIKEIDRVMDAALLEKTVQRLHEGNNIHIHLDLIAGLPYEDYNSFKKSFNDVYRMKPEQLQLGFLKVLKGSKMHANTEKYGIAYTATPPYEVLYTKWLSFDDVMRLKSIEEMVELYYNSNQFATTLPFLVGFFETPFDFYEALARYYDKNGFFVQTPSRVCRYEILLSFVSKYFAKATELIRQTLTVDYYLRENAKTRPAFANPLDNDKKCIVSFYKRECEERRYLKSKVYEGRTSRELERLTHIEPVGYDLTTGHKLFGMNYLLFDYDALNCLTKSATIYVLFERD